MVTIKHQTPNKSKKLRESDDITLAVIHYTGSMNASGSVAWFEDPAAKVSAHYIIGREGQLHVAAPHAIRALSAAHP